MDFCMKYLMIEFSFNYQIIHTDEELNISQVVLLTKTPGCSNMHNECRFFLFSRTIIICLSYKTVIVWLWLVLILQTPCIFRFTVSTFSQHIPIHFKTLKAIRWWNQWFPTINIYWPLQVNPICKACKISLKTNPNLGPIQFLLSFLL